MIQNVKVTFGNISKNQVIERYFDSKNAAFIWLNHQMVRESSFLSVHELYFRIESNDRGLIDDSQKLPF